MQQRQPCPDRILDDLGMSFAMGGIGSAVFHFFKGMKASPWGHRFVGGLDSARLNAPRTAGAFAAWGVLFSTFDCALVYARQKEDPWNSIIAGGLTAGLLSARKGPRAVAVSALCGAGLLAMMEGMQVVMQKQMQVVQIYQQQQQQQQSDQFVRPKFEIVDAKEKEGFLGRLFGGEKKEQKNTNSEAVMRDIFDFSPPPMPDFELQ